MNFDQNISPFRNVACGSCHMPVRRFQWTDPVGQPYDDRISGHLSLQSGEKRTAQRYTYSPDFPVLELDPALVMRLTSGCHLGRVLVAETSGTDGRLVSSCRVLTPSRRSGPPVDTQEMGFPDTACIAFRLSQSAYAPLFEAVWGAGSLSDIKVPEQHREYLRNPRRGGGVRRERRANSTKGRGPHQRPTMITIQWAQVRFCSTSGSVRVSAFSSKFDAFLAGNYTMTSERDGGLQPFQRQRQLQFMPSRRKIHHPDTGPDRYW